MIAFRCQHCKRPLEVDDDLAGKQAACPHCRQISDVPTQSVRADGVPIARPAGGVVDVGHAGDEEDRAAAMGLPPDSGPEEHVVTVHPAVLRARPMQGLAMLVLTLGGLAGVAYAHFVGLQWLLVIAAMASAAGACWWAWEALHARRVVLIISTKRTTERRGWLRRTTKEILHDKVQDIQITQSFPQRVLGVGSIGISNAGEAGVEIQVDHIPNPRRIRSIIDAYREIG